MNFDKFQVDRIKNTFSALKHRNFRYFWIGQCISLLGTWMQKAAQVWLVYSLTNSPLLLGFLGIAQYMPVLIFSLFAGVFADRFPKKRLLYITQITFMIQSLILAFLVLSGNVRYWHVLALATVFGFMQSIDMPSRQSFFIELVGKEDLMNAIALNSSIVNLAKIIGPAVAGIIMIWLGPGMCFLLNGISYIAVLTGLYMIKSNSNPIVKKSKRVISDIKEGVIYVKNSSVLLVTAIILAIMSTFAFNVDVMIPVFAKTILGKGVEGYTALLSATGIGSFIGAIFMASRSKKGLRKSMLITDAFIMSTLLVLMSFMTNYYICLFIMACIGFTNLTFMNMANSTLQLNSTDEYRGRVMSVYGLLHHGPIPLGNFFAGLVMEKLGGNSAFLLCGIITMLFIIAVYGFKRKELSNWVTS